MNTTELKEVVAQRSSMGAVLGRIAFSLRSVGVVEQSHADDRSFTVAWQERDGFRRCTISSAESPMVLARFDLHENATLRAEIHEPCSFTIAPDDDLLCLTRLV